MANAKRQNPRPILWVCLWPAHPPVYRIPDVLHEWVLDLLHPDAADLAGDQLSVRVHGGSVPEEVAVAGVGLLQLGQLLRRISGEPGSDLIYLVPGAALFLCLGYQQEGDLGKDHFCYIHPRHGVILPAGSRWRR